MSDPSEFWAAIEERLTEALARGDVLRTPVSLIVHGHVEVNEQLRRGRDFFIDIARDGIVLYDDDGVPFTQPQPLEPRTALKEAHAYFSRWFCSGASLCDTAAYSRGRVS